MITIKRLKLLLVFAFIALQAHSQETSTLNGVADVRTGSYAFTNASIVKDAQTTISNATLVIKNGKIIAVTANGKAPADAVTIDCTGKFIYPSFIDIYSDYGVAAPTRAGGRGFDFFAPTQFNSNTKGAFGWNQAIKSEINAASIFNADESKAKGMRDIGFGVMLTHAKDGIARGTGAVVDLSDKKENFALLKEKAASFYSFSKGTSTQSYPGSIMGSIALLRQSFLDGQWYKNNVRPATEGTNLSLQAWNNNLQLPQIFEAGDKWNDLRADRIGDEFGTQFIIKAGQNEYQRIAEIKATKASYIVPLNFPVAMDVEDAAEARFISLADLKQWEMAPSNPAAFEKAGINFCLTMADLKDGKQFLPNLRKAIQYGLTEKAALDALTKNPAQLLGMYNEIGSIEVGKYANFIITNGNVFAEKTAMLQNWIQGEKYIVKEDNGIDTRGKYSVKITDTNTTKTFMLEVKDNSSADVMAKDTIKTKYSNDGRAVKLQFAETKQAKKGYRLNGINNGGVWNGMGTDSLGNSVLWTADFVSALPAKVDSSKKTNTAITMGTLTYPNMAYGVKQIPTKENVLIKNATVWTNESEGILTNADVLVENGKIVAVGKNLTSTTARQIDGTGKHVTAGIIDEHSHIAAASINEGGQSVTSEVRIGDNLDPDDVDIYRQLSGGVTTSHILHGSANTIGGQTQLIKLRWGANDTALKFMGADGFIKFALGENVKRNPAPNNNRFPDTRMGVEQVQIDAFTRAQDYAKALKLDPKKTRRDLELDALVEIMEKKRFITCHSYIASEILETMQFAEKFGFKINTFTHILEGYKVADKMKAHGVAASTFSDWWAYKVEVQDAIPANPAIMHNVGLNVAINSDDAEMARRLNQEAAKSIKYAGMSEEDALKMVTINPAKMLHIDKQVGSIKKGKDADLVLWSDNPLSMYAKAEKTMVDGIIYFDREKDLQIRKEIFAERNRIIQKLIDEKSAGSNTTPAKASLKRNNTCNTNEHEHGLLDEDEAVGN
jgi:imidazolonepropionase-like amidohydrolase